MEFLLQVISELFNIKEDVENNLDVEENKIELEEELEEENIFAIMNFH